MPVYVDSIKEYPREAIQPAARRCGTKWCHMWADTPTELYAMAQSIGMRMDWVQNGGGFLYFDLVPSRRSQALRYGAVETQVHPTIIANRRTLGKLPGRTIKALSLWQPWASLIAWGEKEYETRDWPLSHRGPLAIHATKAFRRESLELCFTEPYRTVLERHGFSPGDELSQKMGRYALPLGKLVCVVEMVNCEEAFPRVAERISDQERAFGNYEPDRFAFRFTNVRPLADPVAAQGKQGVWSLSQFELAEVLCQVDLDAALNADRLELQRAAPARRDFAQGGLFDG